MGPDAMILVFLMLSFKPTFSLSYFTLIKRLTLLVGMQTSTATMGNSVEMP